MTWYCKNRSCTEVDKPAADFDLFEPVCGSCGEPLVERRDDSPPLQVAVVSAPRSCLACNKKPEGLQDVQCPACESPGAVHKSHFFKESDFALALRCCNAATVGDVREARPELARSSARRRQAPELARFELVENPFRVYRRSLAALGQRNGGRGLCHGCLGANEQSPPEPRSSAHCIVSNQALAWYSPAIVAAFRQMLDTDHYRISYLRNETDQERAVDFAWSRSLELAAPFEPAITWLCRELEQNQHTPARLVRLLGRARYQIAQALPPVTAERWGVRIENTRPPSHGGESIKARSSSEAELSTTLGAMIPHFRAPVYEFGKQCPRCESLQGVGSLIQRALRASGHETEPVGKTVESFLADYRGKGGAWQATVDFLRPGLDRIASNGFVPCYEQCARSTASIDYFLDPTFKHWALFGVYYMVCMLEGALGFSPFRSAVEGMNPCPISDVTR